MPDGERLSWEEKMILTAIDDGTVNHIVNSNQKLVGAEIVLRSLDGSRLSVEIDPDLALKIGAMLVEVGLQWERDRLERANTIISW